MRHPLFATLVLASALPAAATADLNRFAQCALVPWASFDAGGRTTAVGLTAKDGGSVVWAYFDENGDRLASGDFTMRDDTLVSMVLDQVLAPTLAEIPGFLLACLDDNDDGEIDGDDGADLAANAFYVDLLFNDVAYIPTLPVYFSDLDDADPEDWDRDPVDNLTVGAASGQDLYMQYFIDGVEDAGDATVVVIYSTDEPDTQITMRAAGPEEIVNVPATLLNSRVNVLDVEAIPAMTDTMGLRGSGFLRWTVGDNVNNVFAFSLVLSPAFGALQTLPAHVDPAP